MCIRPSLDFRAQLKQVHGHKNSVENIKGQEVWESEILMGSEDQCGNTSFIPMCNSCLWSVLKCPLM